MKKIILGLVLLFFSTSIRANEIEKNKVLLDISEKLLTRPQSSARNCTTTVVGKLFNTRCN